jgi:hypothetical protein
MLISIPEMAPLQIVLQSIMETPGRILCLQEGDD